MSTTQSTEYTMVQIRKHRRWYFVHVVLALLTFWTGIGALVFGWKGRQHKKAVNRLKEELKAGDS